MVGRTLALVVALLGCERKPAPAPEPPLPPIEPVDHLEPRDTGPLARAPMFGPYESRKAYCAAKAECCCEPAITALKTPAVGKGPWRTVDLLRDPAADGQTGPWHLVVQTERGWFGEFFGFMKLADDEVSASDPTVEVTDWLGLGSPQLFVKFKYSVKKDGRLMKRELLAVIGVGLSGTPSYFTIPVVRTDESAGNLTGWVVTVDTDGKGNVTIAPELGTPRDDVPIGTTPITFR